MVGDVLALVRVIGPAQQVSLGDWLHLFGVDLQLFVVDHREDKSLGSDVELHPVRVAVLAITEMVPERACVTS